MKADTAETRDITAPAYPPSDCGKESDLDDKLWAAAVADVLNVHEPEKGKWKYVILDGAPFGWKGKYNKLLVPKVRVTGIECARIFQSDALNVWKYAWEHAQSDWPSTDVLVGINSYDGRTDNQLHIHLTAFNSDARAQLDNIDPKIPRDDLHSWNNQIHVLGSPNDTYVYRIAHVATLDKTNPFVLLNHFVVGNCNDLFAQSLAVVAAKHGGYFLIATQGKKTQGTQQPDHPPTLNIGGNWGTSTCEPLMDRHGK